VENDREHIWLRQSITQTVQGQTRTLEIGVSVRPGMTADQIEALLREADAGMQQLSRHLAVQMAGQNGRGIGTEPRAIEPAREPAIEPKSVESVRAVPAPAEPEPAQVKPPDSRPALHVPASRSPSSQPPPSPATPPNAREEEAASLEPLSVKDFLDAARTEMNLNPKQAMEKLNVRSLSGLNLREALEMLHRQALGSAAGGATSASEEPRGGSGVFPSLPPRYFEEEDEAEFDVTLTFDEDSEDSEDDIEGEDGVDNEEPDDLEDVPDFDAEPVTSTSTKITPIAGERSRAMQIIGQLRQAAGGGTPTSQQRVAYRNIILRELGDQSARALVQGLWRVGADKLGAEQVDALLSWGKRDSFGEEAELVLKSLRAEREQKSPDGGDAEARPPRRAAPPRGGS
jgi:hypothetical protein